MRIELSASRYARIAIFIPFTPYILHAFYIQVAPRNFLMQRINSVARYLVYLGCLIYDLKTVQFVSQPF